MQKATLLVGIALMLAAAAARTETPATPAISNLSWISGAWTMSGKNGSLIEEYWTTPRAGMMLGMSRTVKGEKTIEFEFLRIEQRGDTLVYIAQPQGRPPTEFTASSMGNDEIVFSNLAHDFPKRIRYRRDGGDGLVARVEDETGKKGMDFPYRRAAR
jgi:hypothetical protein